MILDKDLILAMAAAGFCFVATDAGMTRSNVKGWQDKASDQQKLITFWIEQGFSLVAVAKHGHGFMIDIDDPEACKARGFKLDWLDGHFLVDTPSGGVHAYGLHDAKTESMRNTNVHQKKCDAKSPKLLELKIHNVSTAGPTAERKGQEKKVDGLYRPRGPFTATKAGLHPDLIAWLEQNAEALYDLPQASVGPVEFHDDFELVDFLNNEGCAEHACGDVDGAFHVTVEECPHCGRGAPQSTLRAGKTKFIFGGTNSYGFLCHACGINTREEHERLMKKHNPSYTPWDGFIYKLDDPELVKELLDGLDVEDAEEAEAGPVAKTKLKIVIVPLTPAQIRQRAQEKLRCEIDEVLDPCVEKGEKKPAERQLMREASMLLYEHLKKNGKLYNCGNVATYVDSFTHELVEVVKGGDRFGRMLLDFGIQPAEKFTAWFGRFMGAQAVHSPKNAVYNMSFYNRQPHCLYLNEYANNFLKIDADGNVTRMHNGDDDILFRDGTESECDPLCADLTKLEYPHALKPDGLIQKEILDTILYTKEGVGRDNAHVILMTALLSLFFYERVPANPYIYLYGPGATLKSSLAVKVGKLIQGNKFSPRPATDDEKSIKDLALSLPFIVLDEANNLKRVMNILKTFATGGMDSRRELFTTANMRHTPYQARFWMTANTASLTNETISSRMMIIDAAARPELEPYRAVHYLSWSTERRNEIWTELVARLRRAMMELKVADEKGEGDLSVAHRMSDFFVFGRTLAKQEGWETDFLAAQEAMTNRQQVTSTEGNDIVDLVTMLPKSYANTPRKANEWAAILSRLVPESNIELKRNAARTNWVAWQFSANLHLLTLQCGMSMTVDKKRHTTSYAFSKLDGHGQYVDQVAAKCPETVPEA